MGKVIIFDPHEERREAVYRFAERADLTVSELLRRMVDECLRDDVMNRIVPRMSGQISVGRP